MAYAAVVSLELTTKRLLNSSYTLIVPNYSLQILKLLYREVCSLRQTLKEFDRWRSIINMKRVKILEGEIIDSVLKFEDVLEFHVLKQFTSQSEEEISGEEIQPLLFYIDLQGIRQDINTFIQMVKKMKKAYIHELRHPYRDEDEENDSRVEHFGENESTMVGLSDLYMRIENRVGKNSSPDSRRIIVSLVGMAGIGKTTLAKKLFQDPSIASCYNRHAFVKIGPKYRVVDILVDILRQVNPDVDEITLMKGEKILVGLKRMVYKSLKYLSYLIVLDDVWDKELCSELAELFPDDNKGSRVLLTTRLQKVADFAHPWNIYIIRFLDKKESWDLLREKVFGKESLCPPQLESAGKKIAANCEGLPLTIIKVAEILSKADKTPEYWNEVATEKQNAVYTDAYEEMSKSLYPSYDYLDQHLKACFLYLGAFPQNYPIPWDELINLWSAEGFPDSEPIPYLEVTTTFGTDMYYYIFELESKNIIMYNTEECGYYLHSSFWYLCNKEVASNKFFYALNGRADGLAEGIKCQRRLCIRNSVLFAIKDVYSSMASVPTVRSLLCTDPYHQYPVSLCLEPLKLLRVLTAVDIRLYEFPMEVVKLVQLRYLALTCDGNLPHSISKLWNLEYLIVRPHLNIIKSFGNSSYLPMEIWNMKELKYLTVTGSDLPIPCDGSVLPNLLSLSDMSPQSCSRDVLTGVPNLTKLGIRIELTPNDAEPLNCLNHISHLHKLKVLECVIMNPTLKDEAVVPPAALPDFPSSLTGLVLRGSGYSWKEMTKISSLPNLRTLMLGCYAFRGSKWEVHDNEFQRLETLSIEDSDLEKWTFQNSSCLSSIRSLIIKHCYKLKEIPLTFGGSLERIEVVDCNLVAVSWANELKKEWEDKYSDHSLILKVHCSWDDENINS